jgi:hypothetical protein
MSNPVAKQKSQPATLYYDRGEGRPWCYATHTGGWEYSEYFRKKEECIKVAVANGFSNIRLSDGTRIDLTKIK